MNVGVFDSGLGGLTVVRELRQRFPQLSISYLGDTARVPYGSKSARTVARYAQNCLSFLLERDVELVLIACNTASAHALPALGDTCPIPLIGAVVPGARAALAASLSAEVAVLGTLGTIASGAYQRAIKDMHGDAQVIAKACPLFVPLAEEGWVSGPVPDAVAQRYLSEVFAESARVDTIVLGCTHYPLLRATIADAAAKLWPHALSIVDSAGAMVDKASEYIAEPVSGNGSLRVYLTDASRMHELGPRFLGSPIDSIELVDL